MQNQEIQLNVVAEQTLAAQETPVVVEELSIDELAVREEYAACVTIK